MTSISLRVSSRVIVGSLSSSPSVSSPSSLISEIFWSSAVIVTVLDTPPVSKSDWVIVWELYTICVSPGAMDEIWVEFGRDTLAKELVTSLEYSCNLHPEPSE